MKNNSDSITVVATGIGAALFVCCVLLISLYFRNVASTPVCIQALFSK